MQRQGVKMKNEAIISRRKFLAATGAVIPAIMAGSYASAKEEKKPNIVWLVADDAGWKDFGCYGHPTIRTPNIDKLAEEGVRFTHAFVTSPQCSPCRASMWTGKYAHSVGAEDLHAPLPKDQVILPELLKQKGYYSGNVCKLHLGKDAADKFDFIHQDIKAWQKFMDTRPKNRPFFLTLGFRDPHRPYQKGTFQPPHTKDDVIVPPYLPDTDEVREDLALYYDEISRMDAEIGDLLKRLKQEQIEEDTVVFFWSDNGQPFPRAKGTLYDAGIAEPLIVRWKANIAPGVRHGLASLVDITPTVLDIVGIKVPPDIQGRSMLPEIKSCKAPGRKYIFAERNWHDIDDHIRAVRNKRFKYIRNYFPKEPFCIPADAAASVTFQEMRKLRDAGTLTAEQMLMFRWPRPAEELYDLENDPDEFRNLADEAAYQTILQQLRRQLDKWIAETDDVPPEKRLPNKYDYETGQRLKD